jgi:hypothetical protein
LSAPVLSRLFHTWESGRSLPNGAGESAHRLPAGPLPDQQAGVANSSFAPGAPRPNPQSQSFSLGYGSILPTSLIYILLSTRGCTPWRPDAVMSTTRGANTRHRVFKGRQERTGRRKDYAAFPATTPYRRAIRFQGLARC